MSGTQRRDAAGPLELVVPALLAGVRADRAVAMLTGVSRSVAAALVASGKVSAAGHPLASRSTPLVAGEVLRVELLAETNGPVAEPGVPLELVAVDDQFVVVDKPPGLVVHPGAGHPRGTLVNGLLARFPELRHLAEEGLCPPDRPGIVHRLDRGTSGLLVVARTPLAYRSLVSQFAGRSVDRRYLALVSGDVEEDRGAVDAPVGRSVRAPVRMAVSAQGRPARTDYVVLGRYRDPVPTTLLALRLGTGRTHQIRVHLSAIGHPVVGDALYGGPDADLAPGRLFLHAYLLGFDHPADGSRTRWLSKVPRDLARVLPVPPPDLASVPDLGPL